MVLESPALTRTERNLWNAIVAEALAYLKYNAYAHKALDEGHPEVAQIFQEVAGAENIHDMNHLRVSGDIGTSTENLRAVTTGEAKEASTVYPTMIQEALEEGRADAVESFAMAMERDLHHLEVFTHALAHLEARRSRAANAAAAPSAPVALQPGEQAPGETAADPRSPSVPRRADLRRRGR